MLNVFSEKTTKPEQGGISWGPFSAVMVAVLTFIGAQILATFLIAVIFKQFDWYDKVGHSIAGQFLFVLMTDTLILLALWLFLRRQKASFRLLGFTRSPAWKDLGYALLGFVAYFGFLIVATVIVGLLTPIDLNQKQELGFDTLVNTPQKVMALISLVILPPLVEEIVFRGFLFTSLRKRLAFIWATLFTSLLFAAPHLLASSEGLLWIAGVDTVVLSAVLCYLREKTGALWAPIAVHALKNGIAFTLLLNVAIIL